MILHVISFFHDVFFDICLDVLRRRMQVCGDNASGRRANLALNG